MRFVGSSCYQGNISMTMLNPLQRDQFPDIVIEARAAFEFLMSLHVFFGDGKHKDFELENEWFEQIRAKISPELRALIEKHNSYKVWIHLFPLAYNSALPR